MSVGVRACVSRTVAVIVVLGGALVSACGSAPSTEELPAAASAPAVEPAPVAEPAAPAAQEPVAPQQPERLLIAWMEEDEDAGYAPLTVRFLSNVKGGVPPYTITWNFDDGSPPSAEPNPVHTYTKPGRYLAELFATDSRGEKDDDFTIIEIW